MQRISPDLHPFATMYRYALLNIFILKGDGIVWHHIGHNQINPDQKFLPDLVCEVLNGLTD